MHEIRGLYAISNGPRHDYREAIEAVLIGGARIVQCRDKTADHVRRSAEAWVIVELCKRHSAISTINDDVELTHACGAAGVHSGAADAGITVARARLGDGAVIGISCYDSMDLARHAIAAGANHVAFVSLHPSPTKPRAGRATPDLLLAANSLGVPVVAIGGITADNAASLSDAGADCVTVLPSLSDAADIESAARQFSRLFF